MVISVGSTLFDRYKVQAVRIISPSENRYRALDLTSGQNAAVIQYISENNEPDPKFVGFLDAVAHLTHPNVAPGIGHSFIPEQGYYLIFDAGSGTSLQERVKENGPLPYQEAVPILLNLCDALDYLNRQHKLSVTGNFSPEDIYTTQAGQVILVPPVTVMPGEKSTDSERILQEITALARTGLFVVSMHSDLFRGITREGAVEVIRKFAPTLPESIAAVLLDSLGGAIPSSYTTLDEFKTALLIAIIQIPPETLRISSVALPPPDQAPAPAADTPLIPPQPPPPEPAPPIRRRVPWGFV